MYDTQFSGTSLKVDEYKRSLLSTFKLVPENCVSCGECAFIPLVVLGQGQRGQVPVNQGAIGETLRNEPAHILCQLSPATINQEGRRRLCL